jgi:DNA-binding MarR family transcriptional regulator
MKWQSSCVCVNLRRAARAVSQIYDDALAPSGIKITQFSLLRGVQRNEPVAISVLADELDLDRTTMARNLAPLERDGLVTLAAGEDQRVTEVRLTAKGSAVVARAYPLWEQAQAEIARRLAPGRVDQLREIAADSIAAAATMHDSRIVTGSPARTEEARRPAQRKRGRKAR